MVRSDLGPHLQLWKDSLGAGVCGGGRAGKSELGGAGVGASTEKSDWEQGGGRRVPGLLEFQPWQLSAKSSSLPQSNPNQTKMSQSFSAERGSTS